MGTSNMSAIIRYFFQPVRGLRRGDVKTRILNAILYVHVHSAEGWQELLDPALRRYQKKGRRLLFRGDAAFGKPEVYEYLEQEKIGYAIRLSANTVLQREFARLLVRLAVWCSRRPNR